MRGLYLKNVNLGSEDQFSPSPEPQLQSSRSPAESRLPDDPPKRTGKYDHIKVLEISVGAENTLLPSNKCFMRCTYYFWQMNDEEGVNWKKVPTKTKDFYWGEFKKYVTHPGFSEEETYKAWKKKASNRYADWISNMSTREVKPRGVEQKTWDQWTKYWKTEEFQKKSSLGKRNRNRDGKGMVNHTGGSQTFDVLLKCLWKKDIFHDLAEFHQLTHTRKIKPGVFCDDHAIQVNVSPLFVLANYEFNFIGCEISTREVQLSCFNSVFDAPIRKDVRSHHFQHAVSLLTFYLAEAASQYFLSIFSRKYCLQLIFIFFHVFDFDDVIVLLIVMCTQRK